jgi:hypothetical protein
MNNPGNLSKKILFIVAGIQGEFSVGIRPFSVEKVREHKQLLISPVILVRLSSHRFIIALFSWCVDVSSHSWVYLLRYSLCHLACTRDSSENQSTFGDNEFSDLDFLLLFFYRLNSKADNRLMRIFGYIKMGRSGLLETRIIHNFTDTDVLSSKFD